MQRTLAIIWLTWKAAVRFRLFIVITGLLLATVVAIPLLIKDDGTARGFTQIVLTYTLSAITGLLGLSTLWLSCGILARDIEEAQMQVVAVKPIARWQIWLGKWLGLVTLNAALLAIAGGGVFGLLVFRSGKLPEKEQQILRSEIFVARGSVKETGVEAEIDAVVDEQFAKAGTRTNELSPVQIKEMRKQMREYVKSARQLVAPGDYHVWELPVGTGRRDLPLQLRVKFNSSQSRAAATYGAVWQVGTPHEGSKVWRNERPMSLAPDTFHEFSIPSGLVDDKGILTVVFINPNDSTLLFPLEEGMEVLYPEGSFALNFARGLGIILCWMSFLAAVGLAAASLLSFPVAAFFSLAVLVVGMSSGTIASAIENGTVAGVDEETGQTTGSTFDVVLLPTFKGMLVVINMVKNYSPIDALSTGRSITWNELGTAFTHIVVILGGVFAVLGIWLFSRRELAAAQGTQ